MNSGEGGVHENITKTSQEALSQQFSSSKISLFTLTLPLLKQQEYVNS